MRSQRKFTTKSIKKSNPQTGALTADARFVFNTFMILVSFVVKNLCSYQIYSYRHLIPCATFERSPCALFLNTSPLLEEKWDSCHQALIPNIRDPLLHDRVLPTTRVKRRDLKYYLVSDIQSSIKRPFTR